MKIREMTVEDWPCVRRIYQAGIDSGRATFQTSAPEWEAWNSGHREICRLVAEEQGQVAGWVALSPTSARECYSGVNEVSVYVAPEFQGRGVGTALMRELVERSEQAGVWQLYAAIFEINTASIKTLEKAGFRKIGFREAIARDKNGVWQNTVLMERRSRLIW